MIFILCFEFQIDTVHSNIEDGRRCSNGYSSCQRDHREILGGIHEIFHSGFPEGLPRVMSGESFREYQEKMQM